MAQGDFLSDAQGLAQWNSAGPRRRKQLGDGAEPRQEKTRIPPGHGGMGSDREQLSAPDEGGYETPDGFVPVHKPTEEELRRFSAALGAAGYKPKRD